MYFCTFPQSSPLPRFTIHFTSKSKLYRFLRTPEQTEFVYPFELGRRHCLSTVMTGFPNKILADFTVRLRDTD